MHGHVRAPKSAQRAPVAAHANRPQQRLKTFGAVLGAAVLPALPAMADVAVSSDAVLGAGAVAGVAGLGGLLIATDPQKRRAQMAQGAGGDEMKSVKDYFDGSGAPRFCKHLRAGLRSCCKPTSACSRMSLA